MAKIETVLVEIPVGRIAWLKQAIPDELRFLEEAPVFSSTASAYEKDFAAYAKQAKAEYKLLLNNLEKHAKV